MAWPQYAGALVFTKQALIPAPKPPAQQAVINPGLFRERTYGSGRGCYVIEGEAHVLFYWGTSPPDENSAADAEQSDFPYTTDDTFTDGTYYFAARVTNGLYTSPFIPVGPNEETYLRIDLSSGTETEEPPGNPKVAKLIVCSGGVVKVVVAYFQVNSTVRADQICITATYDGTDPAEDTPDYTIDIPAHGPVMKTYDLPAQSHGTTVKARVQMRRNDGTSESPNYIYSDTDSDDILTAAADAQGPSAPMDAEIYPGILKGE